MMQTLSYRIRQTAPYINWSYFFHAWSLPTHLASVAHIHDCIPCRQRWLASFSDDEKARATEACRLYEDALSLLRQWDEANLQTYFRVSLQEAMSDGDDILLPEVNLRLPLLRQQHTRPDEPCLSLADFVPPVSQGKSGRIGIFCSTVDAKMEAWDTNDDYRRMLAQTLADRLAEATAEKGHEEVRRTIWGFAPDEHLTPQELFQEKYQGLRPAVGYPSLPDQSINFLIDSILRFQELGITLTSHGAMRPHATTSGLIISHPAARHFAIGPITTQQLNDYARRRGVEPSWLEPFLANNLRQNY